MTIEVGAKIPEASLLKRAGEGFEAVSLSEYIAGRKVVMFGLPGAFTGTCSTAHLPSFMRTADDFRGKGVDEIICVAVNDPFVINSWGDSTGATEAGITMLADPAAELTKALGMAFTVPAIGFYDRSNRYALVLEDGVITHANVDEPTVCEVSRGEALLESLG